MTMKYDRISRALHWATALLVLMMISAGLTMTSEVERWLQDLLFIFHKNTGLLILLLVLLRLAWRAGHSAPPLPDQVPRLQRIAARLNHAGLYVLLLVMALSGLVRVLAGGFPIELLDWLNVPPVLPNSEPLAEAAKALHAGAKYALIILIGLHVAAAGYHGLWRRDGVVGRMWPPA